MMFGTIVVSGIQMVSRRGYSQRNVSIVALSLSVGIGFTQVPEIFSIFPQIIQKCICGKLRGGSISDCDYSESDSAEKYGGRGRNAGQGSRVKFETAKMRLLNAVHLKRLCGGGRYVCIGV